MIYEFRTKTVGGVLTPLDTTGWDANVIGWRCFREFGERPGVTLTESDNGSVVFDFQMTLDMSQYSTLQTLIENGQITIVPPPTIRMDFTFDIKKIIADATAAGWNIAYLGKPNANGSVVSSFLIYGNLTTTQKNNAATYIRNLFVRS
jgi:hypothetical protein